MIIFILLARWISICFFFSIPCHIISLWVYINVHCQCSGGCVNYSWGPIPQLNPRTWDQHILDIPCILGINMYPSTGTVIVTPFPCARPGAHSLSLSQHGWKLCKTHKIKLHAFVKTDALTPSLWQEAPLRRFLHPAVRNRCCKAACLLLKGRFISLSFHIVERNNGGRGWI